MSRRHSTRASCGLWIVQVDFLTAWGSVLQELRKVGQCPVWTSQETTLEGGVKERGQPPHQSSPCLLSQEAVRCTPESQQNKVNLGSTVNRLPKTMVKGLLASGPWDPPAHIWPHCDSHIQFTGKIRREASSAPSTHRLPLHASTLIVGQAAPPCFSVFPSPLSKEASSRLGQGR